MNAASHSPVVDQILARRISAILRTHDEAVARSAMAAAVDGGFRMLEFTLTTPGALKLITEFARKAELLVGAGTVLTVEQARQAVEAGAKYLVSPVCDPEVIAEALRLKVASIPGTFTPTEMLAAHRCGADLVKLFPAPQNVAEYVSAVLGPMPFLRIFPTAGVTPENFMAVLKAGAAGVGFVKSLFEPRDMAEKDYAAIQQRAAAITAQLA